MTEEDEDIDLEALQLGDELAYRRLVNKYETPLRNLVMRLISNYDEACEIVQDVFVSFYSHRGDFEGRSKVYTWLYRVATNRSIDLIRKRERQKKYIVKEYRNAEYAEATDNNQVNEIILAEALSKLENSFRLPLLMSEYEGYSYQEISDRLDVPVNTVRTRIFRARKKLLVILKKMGVTL